MTPPPIKLPEGDPCFFCEVVAGRAEKGIIEKTDQTLSLVSSRQYEVGQSLVIPRRHVPTVLDFNDGELDAVMDAVRRLSKALMRAYDPDGITLYQNNGVASFQEVPHFHMHVVPRRSSGGNWGSGPPHIAPLEGRQPVKPTHDVNVALNEEYSIAELISRHI